MAFIISNTSDNTQVLVFSYHEFGGRRRWSGSVCRLKCWSLMVRCGFEGWRCPGGGFSLLISRMGASSSIAGVKVSQNEPSDWPYSLVWRPFSTLLVPHSWWIGVALSALQLFLSVTSKTMLSLQSCCSWAVGALCVQHHCWSLARSTCRLVWNSRWKWSKILTSTHTTIIGSWKVLWVM